jgi:fibronectin-binding autotransporter adhesin
MLLQWLKQLNGAVRSIRKPSRRPRPARSLPLRLEELETRVVPATTLIWTGAAHQNLWSKAANWNASGRPDKTPGAGDTLIFPDGPSQLISQNDIQNLTLASIQFTGAGGGYDLTGSNGISLTGGMTAVPSTVSGSGGTDRVEFPITLAQAQIFTVAAGFTLALNGGVNVSISSGASWTLNDAGTVALGGSSTIQANVDVQAGVLQVNGSLAYNQGVLTVEHNATLTDAGSVTTTSSSQVDDHGQITVAAAANGQAPGSLSLQGLMTVESDGALTDAGTVTVATKKNLEDRGAVTVSHGGTLDVRSGLTVESGGKLDDSGTLTVENPTNLGLASTGLEDAGTLTVDTGGVLNAVGTLTVDHDATLTDMGTVNVGVKTLGTNNLAGTVIDHGDITVAGGGSNGQAAGVLQVSGAGSTLTVESDGTLTDAGTVAVTKSGALDDGHLLTVESGGTLDDGSVVTVEPGAALDDGGAVTVDGGAHFNSHGTLKVEAGQTLEVSGAAVLAGTSQQPAVLAATLTRAAPPVISLNPGATLALDTAGAGTTELNLSVARDFALGQTFTLVANATGQGVQGVFDDANGRPLNEGSVLPVDPFAFSVTYKGGQGGHDVVLTSLATFINDSLLSVPLLLDGAALPTGPLQLTTGRHTLSDPNAAPGGSVVFTVNADRTVDYDQSLDGVLSGRGTSTLVVSGRSAFIDMSALSIPALTLDKTLTVTRNVPFALAFTDLPGTYALVDSAGAGASVAFNLNGDGTVGYDPSLEGVLTGAGTNALVVHGVAVQIDPRPLSADNPSVPVFTVKGEPAYSTGQVQTITVLPGSFVILIDRQNGPSRLDFTVSAKDQVSLVDPTEASFVRFTGPNQVVLLGSTPTQFSIGIVSHLSVPLTLDGQSVPASVSVMLLPGTHTLADPNAVAGGSVTFTVTPAGTVDYDPSLDGILSGRGTSTLIVNGRTIGIATNELSIPALTLDQTLTVPRTLSVVYSFTDLPGTYSLVDSAGSGSIRFLLNGDGTVGYDPLLQGVLLGAGRNELIVRGVAVTVDATALFSPNFNPPLVTSIIVDGQAPSTRATQTVFLLPGAFSIQYTTSAGLNVIVNFTVSAQDVVAFVSDNQNLPGEPLGEAFGNTVFLPPPPL